MDAAALADFANDTDALRDQGLFKAERILETRQGARVSVDGHDLINLCANNYLGLAGDPRIAAAARAGLERWGFGLSSVRFICGTQTVHRDLETRLAAFLGCADAQLYSSCFDANGAVFEPLLGDQDAVVSDALNHASIIDGIRLCKARRFRYANADLADCETQVRAARDSGARRVLIVTDGVFSMDGSIAPLPGLCEIADRHRCLLMVDDSHAVGFLGATGAGTHEHHGVRDRIDILTGTFGKALGGASGGYVAGRAEIVGWLRQRGRPYLFSNTLAPAIAQATLAILDLLHDEGAALRVRLFAHARRFRAALGDLGFTLLPGEHPIIPVMLGDAVLAQRFAQGLFDHGVLAVGFSYPVVPQGKARIRTQMNAALTDADLDQAIAAFATVGRDLGVIA